MSKKVLLIPNIIICIVVSLILFIMPIEYKNKSTFFCVYCVYLFYNIFGCFLNFIITNNNLKNNINNIPIFNLYLLFNIFLMFILFVVRFINISTSLMIIILLIFVGIYSVLVYLLYNSKIHISNTENKIVTSIKDAKSWKVKIEIILSSSSKDKVISEKLNNLYEKVRYMDITSNEYTKTIDESINKVFSEIKENITIEEIEKLNCLLEERKIILKNNK